MLPKKAVVLLINLSTFPETSDYDDCYKWADDVKKWRSGITKKLRQLKQMPFDNLVSLGLHHGPRLIDEILGEKKEGSTECPLTIKT